MESQSPSSADPTMPGYLKGLAALPLGIPLITLGGIIPVLAGVGLAAVCGAVIRQKKLHVLARGIISLSISAAAYALVLYLIFAHTGRFRDNEDDPSLAGGDSQDLATGDLHWIDAFERR